MKHIIVARDLDHVIGSNGTIPWQGKAPRDMRFFRDITLGHTVIMGRKTYESLGRPLPGRQNIVITRQANYSAEGCVVVNSIQAALDAVEPDRDTFMIGGSEIYRATRELADSIYETVIETHTENADTFFDPIDADGWTLSETTRYEADEKNYYPMRINHYVRANNPTDPR